MAFYGFTFGGQTNLPRFGIGHQIDGQKVVNEVAQPKVEE